MLLVGTGFGSAYYFFFANRKAGDGRVSVEVQAAVSRLVVRADWWFTTPTVIIQPITGFAMVYLAGFPLTTPWIALSFALFLLAGACWLPVVWLQIRMAKMAHEAHLVQAPMPALYDTYRRWWELLGYPAFAAMVGVFYLMVVKPALWG
jgi:uncharacterized membrane protein